jgi:hypothetical protein
VESTQTNDMRALAGETTDCSGGRSSQSCAEFLSFEYIIYIRECIIGLGASDTEGGLTN